MKCKCGADYAGLYIVGPGASPRCCYCQRLIEKERFTEEIETETKTVELFRRYTLIERAAVLTPEARDQ